MGSSFSTSPVVVHTQNPEQVNSFILVVLITTRRQRNLPPLLWLLKGHMARPTRNLNPGGLFGSEPGTRGTTKEKRTDDSQSCGEVTSRGLEDIDYKSTDIIGARKMVENSQNQNIVSV